MYEIYVRQITISKKTERLTPHGSWSYDAFNFEHPVENFNINLDDWHLMFDDIAPEEEYKLLDAVLTMGDNSAGLLEITMAPSNRCYKYINTRCLQLEIKVMKRKWPNNTGVSEGFDEIWRGRLLSLNDDFYNLRKCVFEGELSYLCDTSINTYSFLTYNQDNKKEDPDDWFLLQTAMQYIFDNHNNAVEDYKKFELEPIPDSDKYNMTEALNNVNYINIYGKTTLEAIDQIGLDKNKLHIIIKHTRPNDARHIEFVTEEQLEENPIYESNQEINFGDNLLDFAKDKEGFDFITAIIPRGDRLEVPEEDEKYGIEKYVDLVNPDIQRPYNELHTNSKGEDDVLVIAKPDTATYGGQCQSMVVNLKGVEKYGLIAQLVEFPNVKSAGVLKNKAIKYVRKLKFKDITSVEITAVDLNYLNPDIRSFELLERVHCYSEPHGLDVYFRVTKIEIDMLNPENTKYTLGGDIKGITSKSADTSSHIPYKEDPEPPYIPKENPILTKAKERAAQMIIDSISGSYAGFLMNPDSSAPATIWTSFNSDGAGPKQTTLNLNTDSSKLGTATKHYYTYANADGTETKTYYTTRNDLTATKNSSDTVTNKTPSRAYGFVIRDAETDEKATNRWMWTKGGLMCQNKKSGKWQNPALALTMDGAIVANRITTGTLTLAGNGSDTELKVYSMVNKKEELIGSWGKEGIKVFHGNIQLGRKTVTKDKKTVTAYDVELTSVWDKSKGRYVGNIYADNCDLRGKITATSGKIGFWEIKDERHLGSFGTKSNTSGILMGVSLVGKKETSTFGISVPNNSKNDNSSGWGGICYGAEAYSRKGWGNNSFILFDGNEKKGGWSQGGYYVVNGAPSESNKGKPYSRVVFNAFIISDGDSTSAIFDEDFYKKVNKMESVLKNKGLM